MEEWKARSGLSLGTGEVTNEAGSTTDRETDGDVRRLKDSSETET